MERVQNTLEHVEAKVGAEDRVCVEYVDSSVAVEGKELVPDGKFSSA